MSAPIEGKVYIVTGASRGFGLAIVKTCVEACGGSVSARNREPHGLEVQIVLRAANPPSPAESVSPA